MRYSLTKEVALFVLLVPKELAGFVQHLLEAQDNLCTYTTEPVTEETGTREIRLRAPVEWRSELRRWIEFVVAQHPTIALKDDRVIRDETT